MPASKDSPTCIFTMRNRPPNGIRSPNGVPTIKDLFGLPGDPQEHPGSSQEIPRKPTASTRKAQEPYRKGQEPFRKPQEALGTLQETPGTLQETPGSPRKPQKAAGTSRKPQEAPEDAQRTKTYIHIFSGVDKLPIARLWRPVC